MSALVVILRAACILTLVLVAACRPGEGQRCICEGECRRGLVCAQGGRMLSQNECVDPADRTPGECIETEQETLDDMPNEDGVQPDFIYHDLGGKRDIEPGRPPEDDGTMESSTTTTTSDATTGGATTTSTPSTTSTSAATSSSSSGAP